MFETTNQRRIFMTHERDFRLIHQKNLIETVKFGNGFLRYTEKYLNFLATKDCGCFCTTTMCEQFHSFPIFCRSPQMGIGVHMIKSGQQQKHDKLTYSPHVCSSNSRHCFWSSELFFRHQLLGTSSFNVGDGWLWASGLDPNRNSSISPFNEQLMDRNPH